MADGDVVYKVEVDDKEVDKQLNAVNSKIKESSQETSDKQKKDYKETSKEFKKQSNEVVKENKNTNKSITDDSSGTVGTLKEVFVNAADEIGLSFSNLTKAGIIGGLAGLSAKAVSGAVDFDKAMNQFVASTGVANEKLKDYENILKNVYANNYGESFDDIAEAMKEIRAQIGPVVDNWDPTALQEFTESAFALRDTFGYDIQESVRAANAMINNFGIDGLDAMNLIANGAQNGLDFSGELLDSISEYSVQFAKMGFTADEMFKIFSAGAENGAFNLDKIGDAIKENAIRVIDYSNTTQDAYKQLGLDVDDMSKKFASGGDEAREAFDQVMTGLIALDDPVKQNTIGVELFGTMWEDLGPTVVGALSNIEDGAYGTADAMEMIKKVKYDDLGSMFEGLTRQIELLILPLGEALIPILTALVQTVLPILQSLLPPLIEVLNAVITPILGIIQSLTPLIDTITNALTPIVQSLTVLFQDVFGIIAKIVSETITDIVAFIQPIITFISAILTPTIQALTPLFTGIFGSIANTVSSVINNIKGILSGIVSFISGVFSGNWRQAWEGIKQIFSNIVSGFANIFKSPINWIIDGINTFISGLNKIKIPDWVPVVGGKGFNIGKIPRLKVGMDYVPSDFFPAYLDKGEMVLTAPEAQKVRSYGGIQGIESMLSANLITNNEMGLDYGKLAEAMAGVTIPIYLDGKVVGYSITGSVDQNMGIITSRKGRYGI